MPPEIDAEGIRQLVKDWPDEAKAPVTFLDDAGAFGTPGSGLIYTPLVYHAFVGAGLAWLAEKGPEFTWGKETVCFIRQRNEKGWGLWAGPHPLAAVSAAVLAAAKGGA